MTVWHIISTPMETLHLSVPHVAEPKQAPSPGLLPARRLLLGSLFWTLVAAIVTVTFIPYIIPTHVFLMLISTNFIPQTLLEHLLFIPLAAI